MWCSRCGGTDHYAGRCPVGPRKAEALKVKKPWVKPTLTRWVKADSMDTPMDTKIGGMDTPLVSMDTNYRYRDPAKRREQMREYMRKVRHG